MGLFDGLFRRSRRTTEPQVTAQLPDHPQRRGLTFQVGNIQGVGGRMLVKKIDGDFYNVVGLPIARTVRAIARLETQAGIIC